MKKKTVTTFSRALSLGFLLCLLMGTVPALGQESPIPTEKFRVNAYYFGLCFDTENPNRVCYAFAAELDLYTVRLISPDEQASSSPGIFSSGGVNYLRSAQRSTSRRRANGSFVYTRIDANATYADMWPFPDDDDDDGDPPPPEHNAKAGGVDEVAQETPKGDHDGTYALTANAVLPIPVPPKFLIEPYLGVGVSHVFEGEQEGSNFALKADWMPVLSYGLGITAQIDDKVDLTIQYKTNIYFANSLKYIQPDGPDITRGDFDKIDASMLLIGVAYRFDL